MARVSKKRARELQHDRFRDATMNAFDRVGNRLEGQGRTILYALGAILALVMLAGMWSWWSNRRAEEARRALGRAIEIASAPISTPAAPQPTPSGAAELTFPTERERAQRAVDEFQQVASKYGDPYHAKARYFAAINQLTLDRNRGLSELEALAQTADTETKVWTKFALAQARETEGQADAAIALYSEIVKGNKEVIPATTLNLRIATLYEKQGKKKEAADLLFNIADAARKARDEAGKPIPQSSAAREAAQKLETLDPERFAQLPSDPSASGLQL